MPDQSGEQHTAPPAASGSDILHSRPEALADQPEPKRSRLSVSSLPEHTPLPPEQRSTPQQQQGPLHRPSDDSGPAQAQGKMEEGVAVPHKAAARVMQASASLSIEQLMQPSPAQPPAAGSSPLPAQLQPPEESEPKGMVAPPSSAAVHVPAEQQLPEAAGAVPPQQSPVQGSPSAALRSLPGQQQLPRSGAASCSPRSQASGGLAFGGAGQQAATCSQSGSRGWRAGEPFSLVNTALH